MNKNFVAAPFQLPLSLSMGIASLVSAIFFGIVFSANAVAQKVNEPTPKGAEAASAPRVNGQTLNAQEVERARKRLLAAGLSDDANTRELATQEVIARNVFRQAAMAQGLDRDPEVIEAVNDARDGAMIVKFVQRNLIVPPVLDSDVRAEFNRIIADLGVNEYQAIVLQYPDLGTAQQSAELVNTGKTTLELLAQRYMVSGGTTNSGELAWFSFNAPPKAGKTSWVPLAAANALLGLTPGQSSALFSQGEQIMQVKLMAMRPTILPSFEKAAPAIRKLLEQRAQAKATADLISRLTNGARVD